MRHEKRDLNNPLFHSPLLPNGKYDAANVLCEKLKLYNIDVIYTSPFVRCVETIMPYAKLNNVPVHVDYNLYEWLQHPDFENESIQAIEDKSIFSSVSNDSIEISYPESDTSRLSRSEHFMKMLDKKYENTNLNILVCTHMDVAHDLIQYKEQRWPRGYLSMGALIDMQNIAQHITTTLIMYAYFCNYMVPVLRHFIYVLKFQNSLKEQQDRVVKQWQSLHSHCMTTKLKDSVGCLKGKVTSLYLKVSAYLREEYLQTKSA